MTTIVMDSGNRIQVSEDVDQVYNQWGEFKNTYNCVVDFTLGNSAEDDPQTISIDVNKIEAIFASY